ncbi:hypothetical protein L596_017216 [Steinernema carpocapsae]|uniref:Uncharacterized protein n=1 Tax=Steinernema carpocapsae TaxID=34508 RepID=A0A4V6A1M5_STECR|nr:hypothetical protein L596_017216 [Steinernema carpocapsae]
MQFVPYAFMKKVVERMPQASGRYVLQLSSEWSTEAHRRISFTEKSLSISSISNRLFYFFADEEIHQISSFRADRDEISLVEFGNGESRHGDLLDKTQIEKILDILKNTRFEISVVFLHEYSRESVPVINRILEAIPSVRKVVSYDEKPERTILPQVSTSFLRQAQIVPESWETSILKMVRQNHFNEMSIKISKYRVHFYKQLLNELADRVREEGHQPVELKVDRLFENVVKRLGLSCTFTIELNAFDAFILKMRE